MAFALLCQGDRKSRKQSVKQKKKFYLYLSSVVGVEELIDGFRYRSTHPTTASRLKCLVSIFLFPQGWGLGGLNQFSIPNKLI